jgi:hypothetical protein
MCQTGKPILISVDDLLTLGTKEQIGDHNNAYWCACDAQRPPGFNASICAREN